MSAVLKPVVPHLEPMRSADLGSVMEIECDIYEFPWTRGNFEDSLAAGYSCWMYTDGEEAVGYCVLMLVVDEAHLLNLSIARSRQGQGHGRGLLEAATTEMRGHGALSMLLEVRPSNSIGRKLYASAGYEQVGVRKDYYPATRGRENALVLRRKI